MPRGITSTAMHYIIAVLFFIEIYQRIVSMQCIVAACHCSKAAKL